MIWRIGEILIQKKLINWQELEQCLLEQEASKDFVGQILIRKGYITSSRFYRVLAEQFEMDYVDLGHTRVNPKAVAVLPRSIAEKFQIMAFEILDECLVVAIADPMRFWPEEEVVQMASLKAARKVLSSPGEIERAIREHYAGETGD
jgi:type IV pilus assembly protein PilB